MNDFSYLSIQMEYIGEGVLRVNTSMFNPMVKKWKKKKDGYYWSEYYPGYTDFRIIDKVFNELHLLQSGEIKNISYPDWSNYDYERFLEMSKNV